MFCDCVRGAKTADEFYELCEMSEQPLKNERLANPAAQQRISVRNGISPWSDVKILPGICRGWRRVHFPLQFLIWSAAELLPEERLDPSERNDVRTIRAADKEKERDTRATQNCHH
jgi:hypothetical protein